MRPNDNSNDIIELNVGGCTYTTSKTTILSYPESMLSRMISGLIPTATDSKQRIFIDRDGPLFRHILNFLRNKSLNLPSDFSEYAQLRQEADFYRIDPILTYMDFFFSTKLNLTSKNSLNSSMLSLVSIPNATPQLEKEANQAKKGIYITVVSKLYQGTLESLIGCIRILSSIASLDANSRRFMNCLISQGSSNDTKIDNGTSNFIATLNLEQFVCECKFMHEEKLICCKPCGATGTNDPNLTNMCTAIVRLAKRFGITTGYWEDMFYLTIDTSVPNREKLCSTLNDKHNGKLLSSCVCDRRSTYDENTTSTLVERWYITDLNLNKK